MRNSGLEEAQAGIKITGKNMNNFRYVYDTTLMAEWTSLVAQMVKWLPTMRETQIQSLGWDDLLEEGQVFLPGESHRQRSLVGYSPWGSQRVDRKSVV